MFLDLKDLRRSGKDTKTFFFEYTPTNDLMAIPNTEIVLPVTITGEITLTGTHSAYLSGEIRFDVKGECTRCLAEVTKTFCVEFEEEVEENNPTGYSVKNDLVDLGKIVEDAILVDMPVALLCKEDCKGLCAGCGVNLNLENCKCKN